MSIRSLMKPVCLLPAFGVSLLCGVSSAYSQTPRPERPYRGLFGGGVDGANQLLTASGSLGGGYDDNILADARGGGIGNPLVRRAGSFGHFSGGLNYSLSRNRFNAGASAGTSVRYYPSITSRFIQARSGTAGVSVRVLDKPALTLNQSVGYQPFSIEPIFPVAVEPTVGEGVPPDLDVVLTQDHYVSYRGGVGLNHRLTRRASLYGDYAYRVRNAGAYWDRFTSQRAGTGLGVALTRNLGMRIGYGYGETDYQTGDGRVRQHDAGIDFDFSKTLSAARRTTVSFGAGSSASMYGDRTHYRPTGRAGLNYEIARTWNVSLAYSRGVQFIETLQQPLFADSATLLVIGLLNRRVQFRSRARASVGDVGFSDRNGFDTYQGTLGLSIALTRYVGVGIDYSLYHYRFGRDMVPLPGVPSNINRQSVRAHINVWALMHQSRITDVTR